MRTQGCEHRHQKRALDALELELQAVVSHLMWMLENKLTCEVRVFLITKQSVQCHSVLRKCE